MNIAENDAQWDNRSHSVKLDGRASIEHQISIHTQDLVEAHENFEISPMDVLHGLKYVADYRIHGGKMKNLDYNIMETLCQGLLQYANKNTGNLIFQRPTEEADMAFEIFTSFISEVEEFRKAVSYIDYY